ncbi:MAG: HDOD domain-containing protein [Thiobacillaceae bacterium]|nr:HDOD domain-containing protein [Thiobacillaceae bacterium]
MPPLLPLARRQKKPEAESRPPSSAAVEEELPGHLRRFLVRQPVLDAGYRLAGHELRLRDNVPVPVIPGAETLQQMQDEMLLVSTADLNYQRALGNRITFLSVSPATLRNPLVEQLPRDKTVLAIHQPVPSAELLKRCEELGRLGIALALDDYLPRPELAPLLRHCRFVRLDIGRYDLPTLMAHVAEIRRAGGPALVARHVETEEAYAACRKLSFELFQGHFFAQVRPHARVRIDSSRQRIMEVLNLLMGRAEPARIEERFKLDAGLSYKLLRLINSPAYGLRQPVQSIGHALMLLGHDPLYRWLTLLLFTHGPVDPRSQALLRTALIRARFTETLGEARLTREQRGGLFIAGILSMLDALLNTPMEQALAHLRLPDPVVAALTRREGPYAPYLELAMACERFDQEAIARHAKAVGLSADEINLAHVNALIWSESLEV